MVEGGPIDVLTGDYLAELTMLILWKARQKDPAAGYARDVPHARWRRCSATCLDRGIKVVTNAGGLNPPAWPTSVRELAGAPRPARRGRRVEGDDLLRAARRAAGGAGSTSRTSTPAQPLADAGVGR